MPVFIMWAVPTVIVLGGVNYYLLRDCPLTRRTAQRPQRRLLPGVGVFRFWEQVAMPGVEARSGGISDIGT